MRSRPRSVTVCARTPLMYVRVLDVLNPLHAVVCCSERGADQCPDYDA